MGKITSNKNIIPIKKIFELLPQIKWWRCFGVPKYFSGDLAGKMMVRWVYFGVEAGGWVCVCVSVKWNKEKREPAKREKKCGWNWVDENDG